MDVATSYMKSVSWVERWFWFGAMYDMVSWDLLLPNHRNRLGLKQSASKGLTL